MARMRPEDTRPGRKGTPVLLVLLGALTLCIIVFIGLGFYNWYLPDATLEPGVEADIDASVTPEGGEAADGGLVTPDAADQPQ